MGKRQWVDKIATAAVAGGLLVGMAVSADDKTKGTDDTKTDVKKVDAKDYKIEKPITLESCKLPDVGTKELLQFASPRNLGAIAQKNGLDNNGYMKFRSYIMKQAAEKVLADNAADDNQKDTARKYGLQALSGLATLEPKTYAAEFDRFAAQVKKDRPNSDAAHFATAFDFQIKHLNVRSLKNDVGTRLIELNKAEPKNPYLQRMMGSVAELLADRGGEKVATEFLNTAIKELPNSPDVKKWGGLVRRMPGGSMTISGPTLAGTTFDLSAYKGKVVLVDFWATWCPPCVAELPKVKATYDKLHKKGFEIVGVSLDKDREKLESFVKEKEMPWPQVIFSDPKDMYWNNPIAQEYGIQGIPAMFIIGRDGKVVKFKQFGPGKDSLEDVIEAQLAKPAGPLN